MQMVTRFCAKCQSEHYVLEYENGYSTSPCDGNLEDKLKGVKKMTETEFKYYMMAAKAFASTRAAERNYWIGYQYGLHVRHYGATRTEEHEVWMLLHEDGEDAAQRAQGRGYRAGFCGPLAVLPS
ncbi:MAG: hypothetical protein DDT29_02153 [Dehalococcoidia bacterium]|nr:hypothetical protein [Bacillota bacterium]